MCSSKLLMLRWLAASVRVVCVSWRHTVTADEMQAQAPTPPENTPQSESTPIKRQHSGKRAGAGRPPNLLKRMTDASSLPVQPRSRPASTWKPQALWSQCLTTLVAIRMVRPTWPAFPSNILRSFVFPTCRSETRKARHRRSWIFFIAGANSRSTLGVISLWHCNQTRFHRA